MQKVKKPTECPRCESPLTGHQCALCGLWVFDPLDGIVDKGKPTTPDNTVLLSKVKSAEIDRLNAGIFNYIWSGAKDAGVVRTSCTLLGGERGAGKTTMLLMLAAMFAEQTQLETGFIAAEMAPEEIKLYADRLKIKEAQDRIRMIPAMTGGVNVGEELYRHKFGAVILDSLQGLVGSDDDASVAVCTICKEHAMRLKAPMMIVSHINKSGDYAGLEKIQHAVDTLLMLSVDDMGIRTIDVQKNRFGKAQIFSEFEMTETGLVPYHDPEEGDEDEHDSEDDGTDDDESDD